LNKEGSIATALNGLPFVDCFGNAPVSGIKSEPQTTGSGLKYERSMESDKVRDCQDFIENHQTADLAILQSLASRSRIVLCFFSGNSSYSESVYTSV